MLAVVLVVEQVELPVVAPVVVAPVGQQSRFVLQTVLPIQSLRQ
ncbi:hypothetical protein SONE68_2092 [Lacticaseibacillus paracasei]|nr:hypothetical protein SONE68_2092 [Lacticaseibacillus paracasei]GEL37837.1 hypothetical protein LPA06_06880 [Lacticaseibacillus paracasei subsp. tolerans]